jgi:hypothetical protein
LGQSEVSYNHVSTLLVYSFQCTTSLTDSQRQLRGNLITGTLPDWQNLTSLVTMLVLHS